MHFELTDDQMDVHGGAGGSYLFCTKPVMTLIYDVQQGIYDQFSVITVKNAKKKAHYAKLCKITIFRAGPGAAILTLAKRLPRQLWLRVDYPNLDLTLKGAKFTTGASMFE